jgi:hypothetical protein
MNKYDIAGNKKWTKTHCKCTCTAGASFCRRVDITRDAEWKREVAIDESPTCDECKRVLKTFIALDLSEELEKRAEAYGAKNVEVKFTEQGISITLDLDIGRKPPKQGKAKA